MEIALAPSMPIYASGLGIPAGDMLRSLVDLSGPGFPHDRSPATLPARLLPSRSQRGRQPAGAGRFLDSPGKLEATKPVTQINLDGRDSGLHAVPTATTSARKRCSAWARGPAAKAGPRPQWAISPRRGAGISVVGRTRPCQRATINSRSISRAMCHPPFAPQSWSALLLRWGPQYRPRCNRIQRESCLVFHNPRRGLELASLRYRCMPRRHFHRNGGRGFLRCCVCLVRA